MGKIESKIKKRILAAKRILLAGHSSPDYDSVGACLGLYLILLDLGKKVQLASSFADREWDFFKDKRKLAFKAEGKYDLAILLDYGKFSRVAKAAQHYLEKNSPLIISLDHHVFQDQQGDLLWLDKNKSSSSEMVYDLAKFAGWKISDQAAFCLLLGIAYDTNIFVNLNVSAELFAKAGELFRKKNYFARINQLLYGWGNYEESVLFGKNLARVKFEEGLDLAYIIINGSQKIPEGLTSALCHRLVAALLNITGVKISLVLRKLGSGGYKGYLRGAYDNQVDLNALAALFEGGGHFLAAGFKSRQSSVKIINTLKAELRARQK